MYIQVNMRNYRNTQSILLVFNYGQKLACEGHGQLLCPATQ